MGHDERLLLIHKVNFKIYFYNNIIDTVGNSVSDRFEQW